MNYKNIISIHLTKFNSVDEFQKLIDDNKLVNIDAEKLFEHKQKGYLKGFLDKETHRIIAYTHKNDKKKIQFQDEFLDFLKNLKSIDTQKEEVELSIDMILDKISANGIDSLSKKEKTFLESN